MMLERGRLPPANNADVAVERIRWRRVVAAGLLTIGAIWWLIELAGNLYWAPANLANDFWTYRQAGINILLGHAVYSAAEMARPFILPSAAWGKGFVYPPPAALASVPLALPAPALGYLAYSVFTAAALIAVTVSIARREGLTGRRWAAVVAFLSLANGPAIGALASGNLNGLVAASLGLMWLTPRRSGYLAVLGGLVKLFPAAGLAWTLRKRGQLAGPIVLGVILLAITLLVLGFQPWLDFVDVMHNARPSSPYYVQSVARVFGPAVGYASSIAFLALVLTVRDDAVSFALLSLAMIAPAPDLVPHYMLIPMMGVLPLVSRSVARATGHAPAAAPPSNTTITAPAPS